MKRDSEGKEDWRALIWFVAGVSMSVYMLVLNDSGVAMIVPLISFMLFPALVVGSATGSMKRATAQMVMGLLLLFTALVVFSNFRIHPPIAIVGALGAMAGFSNALSGKRLNLLTLIGQIAPLAVATYFAWPHPDATETASIVGFLIGCGLCLAGGGWVRLAR